MKKLIIFVLLIVLAVSLFADGVTIKSVKGKVEYSTDGKTWIEAKPNIILNKGDYISTSFKSSAVLVANDSLINVKPLTRMILDDLTKTAEGPKTELYLVSGKVQVEVKPASKNEITTFKVRSAMATASVRGTGFEFDGNTILGNHGSVELMNNLGMTRLVNGGELGTVGSRGQMPAPVVVKKPVKPTLTKDSTDKDIEKAADDLGSLVSGGDSGAPDEFLSLLTETVMETGSGSTEDDVISALSLGTSDTPPNSLSSNASVEITVQ